MRVQVVEPISRKRAEDFVNKHHYRKTMPKLSKLYYGGFYRGELVAVMTLGWGTQPDRSIKKIFPSLSSEDYYEIGRLCLLDTLPRNSESNFISRVIRLVLRDTDIRVLFSWSDGIMGKPGYVYQSTNFYYAGKIKTDVYMTKEGYLIHPRSARSLLEINAGYIGRDRLYWLTDDFMSRNGIVRLKGYQFRYVLFLCSHKEQKRLMKECKTRIDKDYPKYEDIVFQRKMDGRYRECGFPRYTETLNAGDVSRAIRCDSTAEGLVRFQHPASDDPEVRYDG